MNKTTITIIQDEDKDNVFNILLTGNVDDILKGLAAATAQAVLNAPESYQEFIRTRYLSYLNQATIDLNNKR